MSSSSCVFWKKKSIQFIKKEFNSARDPSVPDYKPMENVGWIALLSILPFISVILGIIGAGWFCIACIADETPSLNFKLVLLLAGLFCMLAALLAGSFAGLKTRQLLLRAEYERRFARD